jgi:GMP synthase-like glutamine amidotransferase
MPAPRRLWIVDPSVNNPEDQAVKEILRGWPGESRLFRPSFLPGDGPEPATGYEADGVVLMGSAASVYDSLPWLEQLSAWLRPILAGHIEVPLLGVCFGHQLIAHLSGAEVAFIHDDHRKRIGVEITELEGGRLLPGRHSLRVVVSHREMVCSRPAGYRVVARRPGVDIDGLEHAELPIFTFQFHPEAREEFALHVGIDPAHIDGRLRDDSRKLISAFLQGVKSRFDS